MRYHPLHSLVWCPAVLGSNRARNFRRHLARRTGSRERPMAEDQCGGERTHLWHAPSGPEEAPDGGSSVETPVVADPNVAPKTKLDNVVFKRFKNFAGISKFKRMGLMAMARTMTADEVAGLRELFKSFDTDNSGTISIDELRQGLKLKSAGPAMEELRTLMKTIDVDGSGELDYEEFIAATLAQSRQASDAAVRRAFDYFDTDGDGSITVHNLNKPSKKMSDVERANLGDIGELIASADTDGDGCIDFNEFMAMMKADK